MKKATLLIQHLETIYTMKPSCFSRISHGFLAIHHDEILALGEGEGWNYVDKDTRIIEGRNHIAIPAFIDAACSLPKATQAPQQMIRELYTQSEIMMRHGTLIANVTKPDEYDDLLSLMKPTAYLDLVDVPIKQGYCVVTPFLLQPRTAQRFCISCGYPNVNCLDQWLCAKLYANAHPEVDALQVLSACTLMPAKALGLSKVGYLHPKTKANVLIIEGNTIDAALSRLHGEDHMQVIKDGVRRFPTVLI